MTPGIEGQGPGKPLADDAAAITVAIAIRPGNNFQERTLAFRIPAALDPAELGIANFTLADDLATFTVAWVHEGDPDGGYFDAPFGESGQTLSGAVNIAKRRLQVYLRSKGIASSFTYQ
jgi:hypothetical protein